MRKKKADRYVQSIEDRNTKTAALLEELLQSKSISSSNTRTGALKLNTVVVKYLKKTLAEFEQL